MLCSLPYPQPQRCARYNSHSVNTHRRNEVINKDMGGEVTRPGRQWMVSFPDHLMGSGVERVWRIGDLHESGQQPRGNEEVGEEIPQTLFSHSTSMNATLIFGDSTIAHHWDDKNNYHMAHAKSEAGRPVYKQKHFGGDVYNNEHHHHISYLL